MTISSSRIFCLRFGGLAFLVGGLLFLAAFLLLNLIPTLPLNDIEVNKWLADATTVMAISNELTVFGALCLIPGTYALFVLLYNDHPVTAFAGSALLFILIILFIILVLVQGRLCYPVSYNIPTPLLIRFILSFYWGCLHMIFLIAGVVNFVYGIAFYKNNRPIFVALSIFFFFNNVVGSFPWLLAPEITISTQIGFCLWFIMMGYNLLVSKSFL